MPRRADPIKKVVLKSGEVHWHFVIDVGMKPKIDRRTGQAVLDNNGNPVMIRGQRMFTFPTKAEARDKRASIIADRAKGTYVADTKVTVSEYLTGWLAGRRTIRDSTRANYRNAVKPVMDRLGGVSLQRLTKTQIDSLVEWMLKYGRRVGQKGTKLDSKTVILMLTVLSMALDDAMKEGILVRNVARLVDRPKVTQDEMKTWTADEAAAFLGYVAGHRLFAAWQMSLYGLRRGEVLGLRWEDVELKKATISIKMTRTIVDGEVVESEPKSTRSKRTLPLDEDLLAALKTRRKAQSEERLAAGSAYNESPWVFVDEVGQPYHPEGFSDMFEVLIRKAGVPRLKLHGTRHTCGTLMSLRGVAPAVIAAWLGHARTSFTMNTYVHSQDAALAEAGQTLTKMFKEKSS